MYPSFSFRSILRTKQGDGNVLCLRTEREEWNCPLNKNDKNRSEWEDRSSTQNGTEPDGTEGYNKKGTRTERFI